MMVRAAQSGPAPRGGFTMIELLVVMLIISVLFGLSFGVIGQSLEYARIEATRTTIRHLDSALQDRLEDFERLNFKPLATRFQAAYKLANGTDVPLELAMLIVKKNAFKGYFPQREEDLYGLDGAAGGDDSPLLQKMLDPATGTWKPDSWMARNGSILPNEFTSAAESSELLYVALTEGSVFGPPPPGIDRIPDRHIGDTDKDGNPEFLDDWGRPLRFYNWTTRLIRPGGPGTDIRQDTFAVTAGVLMPDLIPPRSSDPMAPAGPLAFNEYSHPLNQDSDDVTGALGAALAASPPNNHFANDYVLATAPAGGKAFNEMYYHTPDTFHIPLIVSGGPDESVGLYEPDASDPRTPMAGPPADTEYYRRLALPLGVDTSTGATTSEIDLLYDNITNRQP